MNTLLVRMKSAPMWPGFDKRTWCHMSVEFVVGSRPSYRLSKFVMEKESYEKRRKEKKRK